MMKTLIITGSPRKKGHTIAMAEYLAGQLDGEVEWLSVDNRKDITPCRDCRYCFTHPKCAIDDPMRDLREARRSGSDYFRSSGIFL